MLAALTALLLASPVLVSAGIFARDSGVTMLNEQEFRSVMKQQVSRRAFSVNLLTIHF